MDTYEGFFDNFSGSIPWFVQLAKLYKIVDDQAKVYGADKHRKDYQHLFTEDRWQLIVIATPAGIFFPCL